MDTEGNIAIVRELIGAIERFDVERVGALYHPDAVQTEYPNRLYAKGQVRTRETLLRDLPRGAALLAGQRYEIEGIFGSGDQVAVETRWQGELKVPVGSRKPGESIVAHICMVFTLRDGRVAAQKNYDCYEEF
ncbi:MAG TPA: nuclear transport factor 2 family protein [Devosia sp.]